MKYQWGRNEQYGWPSDKPVWTIGVLVLAVAAMCLSAVIDYQWSWTALQRYWLPTYFNAKLMSATGRVAGYYRLLNVVDRHGTKRLATDEDAVPGKTPLPGGRVIPFVLTEQAEQQGLSLVLEPRQRYKNEDLVRVVGRVIYREQTFTDWAWNSLSAGIAILVGGLVVALPKDRERTRIRKYGRTLRGPEFVTAAEFNRRIKSDGIGFITLEPPKLSERLLRRDWRHIRIPRALENNHIMCTGDSGNGKGPLARQVLMQIAEQDEAAIVYDPALEYTGQFYRPERGDLILNPLDERMPYWSPADEVTHPAEALTLATALFPEEEHENRFFVQGSRKIFAHLLNLKPTPEQLLQWLSDEREIESRVKGTPYAGMLYKEAGPQRGGMFGSLSMVADSLGLLPRKNEARTNWTATEWSRRRRGWIFITSIPEAREQLRPLISMWLDILVLRLMNQGKPGACKVWFILDELATLHKLPQLKTAIRENRKSNNPLMLLFQGRSQIEDIYGRPAEEMFSQPKIRIFLGTSEPHASQWISDTIGCVERERLRESRTDGQMPQQRQSRTYQIEQVVTPLVMKEEISGLPKGHGFLLHRNLVVRFSFPFIHLPKKHPDFILRKPKSESTEPPPQDTDAPQPPMPTDSMSARQPKPEPEKQDAQPNDGQQQTKPFWK